MKKQPSLIADKPVHFSFRRPLSRRSTLKAAGVSLGLPVLDAMTPAFAKSEQTIPKRFVGISLALGLHAPHWTPKGSGFNYKPSRYLRSHQDLRDDFTVISGTSHPDVKRGHSAEASIFSACPNTRGLLGKNTISIDQLMAKHLGQETQYQSLVLSAGGQRSPSYTENGAMIPAIDKPKKLFEILFKESSHYEQNRQKKSIQQSKSIMDLINVEAKKLQRELGKADQEKLDHWFTSVREMELRLESQEKWVTKPKPKFQAKTPNIVNRNNVVEYSKTMLELVYLALATDSTRFITLHHPGAAGAKNIEGVEEGYHSLSHHGRDEDKIDQLTIVEQLLVDNWASFLRRLKNDHLLDDTMVLMTSNLGNASSHDTSNMPVFYAGGGFKHGQHLAFNQKKNYPLPNLYLSTLQRLGLEFETFATSTGTMTGLT